MNRLTPAAPWIAVVVLACAPQSACGADAAALEAVRAERMRPYTGPAPVPIERDGLEGRVLCGYQGWFTTPDDGAGLGWRHWRIVDRAAPGGWRIAVDMLPDVSELSPAERTVVDSGIAGGGSIEVFSSHRPETVLRHFAWMREYGIDGAFVQRFAVELDDPAILASRTHVLDACRAAAIAQGRVYAVMYDLSGLGPGGVMHVRDDWRALHSRMGIGDDPASLRVDGKPLVAVWGIGFGDDRRYSLQECRDLVATLQAEGCAVMCGVPTGWRTLDRDAAADPALHELLARCDVVCPWTVGRYATPQDVVRHADRDWRSDLAWCAERKIDYVPVVFPGFSWHNLKGGPLDQIPRLGGRFLWRQAAEARRVGAKTVYVAMFDEVDEATAIFKCAEPPAALAARFVGLEGLPGDHYLRLTGAIGRLLRGEAVEGPVPPAGD